MIRCPKCGTLNRDSSRFCNECGTPLQRTRVRCPNCGALNPVSNVFCDQCNTRLIPTADLAPLQTSAPPAEAPAPSLKGISLPTRSSTIAPEGAPEEAELPDWLLELTDESTPTFSEDEEELAEAALPDWLSGLSDELSPGAEAADMASLEEQPGSAELPDWMSDLVSEEPAPSEEVDLPLPEDSLAPTELPDWLSDTAEEPLAEPVSRSQEQVPDQEDLPDWLSGISPEEPTDQEPDEGEQALPDWLSTLQEEITPGSIIDTDREEVAEPVVTEEELPDWLSSLTDEETPESIPKKEEAVAPLELPDWMSDVSEPEPAYEESLEEEVIAPSDFPEWMSGDVGDEEPGALAEYADSGAPVESPLPEWILKNADKEPAAVPSKPRALPSWLLAKALPEAALPQPASPAKLPAWLLTHADKAPPLTKQPSATRREAMREEVEEPEMGLPEQAPPEEETSDWLAGLLAEEPAKEITEPISEDGEPDWLAGSMFEEPEEPAETLAAQELPNWLGGIDVEEPTPSGLAELEEELASAEIPDWLAGVVEETAPEEKPATEESPVLEELPDWLSGMGIEETPAEEPAPFEVEHPQEQLPDWLTGVTEEPTITEAPPSEELPAWLTETEGEALASDQAGIFVGEPPASAVPDWLSDLADMSEMGGPGSAIFTEAPVEDLQPEAPAPASAGPDWLPQTSDSDLIGLEPVAPAFIPEAMGDIEAEAPSLIEEGALETDQAPPSWLSELVPSVMEEETPVIELPVDDSLARAEVPMWLQELRPPGTGPLPSLPEDAGRSEIKIPPEDRGGLARAEIPDWVQALRSRVTTSEEAVAQLEPAEQQGPLAGLPGVISPMPTVDIPADFQVPPRPEIPEAIVQQAQLWQQLLEQPRGKARPVAQQRARPGAGTTVVRLLVSALLIIAAIVGFVVGDNRLSSTRPDARPGIAVLRNTIQALQPGDSVILAVEYGLAETAEMQPIAETLTEHLAERQVKVIAVSTLPEGVGLIHELLEASEVTNQLPEGTPPYLSGTYSGIANFLKPYHDEQESPLLLVLASRADRLRWWVEQNNVSQKPLPMGVAVSASIGPRVAPYFNAESIQGWLVGLSDMVAYREFNGDSLRIVDYVLDFGRMLDALLLTHWAASGLILCGLLYALAAGKKGTR